MAGDSRDKYGQRDDDLFADPYGVRQGSQRSQGSAAPQQSNATFGGGKGQGALPLERDEFLFGGKGQGSVARNDNVYGRMQGGGPSPRYDYGDGDLEPQVQEEEGWDNWGPVGSFFWYVYSGGKKCCSMRDRSKPQDMEAAQRASETGRPPQQSSFPEPPGQGYPGGGRLGGLQEDREYSPRGGSGTDRGSGGAQRLPMQMPSQPAASSAKPRYMRPSETDSESGSDVLGSRRGQNARPDVSSFSGWTQAQPDAPKAQPAGGNADSKLGVPIAGDPPRPSDGGGGVGLGASSSAGGRSPGSDASSIPRPGANASPASPAPKRWEWPPWCLNFKAPSIEVFVVDEDTGVGRWVEAEPQSRVVDTAGRDAYLCAEYNWDGDYYVQDFGPQHVRRRGQKETVFERLEKGVVDDD